MSEHPHFRVENEEDVLPGRAVILVTIVTLVVCLAGIGVAWWIVIANEETPVQRAGAMIPRHAPREIQMIDQTLIERDASIARQLEAERRVLSSYGWVDRENGLVHIPIEEAMKRLTGEHR